MEIRLADADRERLGCPEWLTVDIESLSIEDAEALEAAGGDWTIYFNSGARSVRNRVWLGLHKAGVTVTFAELTFDLGGMQVKAEPGKAPSASGGSPTPPTSAPSTPRSTRRK